MDKKQQTGSSRRQFITQAGAGVALFSIVPSHVLGGQNGTAPSDKIRLAGIGVGGQGGGDMRNLGSSDFVSVVGLCDVDERRASGSFKRWPDAKRFTDFRKMFDKMEKDIDAVLVATPDHNHAIAAIAAMTRGKHVYCEKPLSRSIYEVRAMMKAAKDAKVITQLGNQGHSSDYMRLTAEWIASGAIGKVSEVHVAFDNPKNNDRRYYKDVELHKLEEKHEVPVGVDWRQWVGPVKYRPYNPVFMPGSWRGWSHFGSGVLGDWFCHIADPAFWSLDLGLPLTVHAEVHSGYDRKKHFEVFPNGTKITFEMPSRKFGNTVKLIWTDGTWVRPKPAELPEGARWGGIGATIIGDKAKIIHGSHGAGGARLIPDATMKAVGRPEQTIPRVKGGHHKDFLDAIREGRKAGSDFVEYGGPLTEVAMIGLVAMNFPGQTLRYDAENMRFANNDAANKFIKPTYYNGWKLA